MVINEFLASNIDTNSDEHDDSSDWIELYNPTGSSIDLTGWKLVDGAEQLVIPAVEIPGRAYLVIWASGKDRRDPNGELHTA